MSIEKTAGMHSNYDQMSMLSTVIYLTFYVWKLPYYLWPYTCGGLLVTISNVCSSYYYMDAIISMLTYYGTLLLFLHNHCSYFGTQCLLSAVCVYPWPCVLWFINVLSSELIMTGAWSSPTTWGQKLTTFITPFGRYYFEWLPFGICSAPEYFQHT